MSIRAIHSLLHKQPIKGYGRWFYGSSHSIPKGYYGTEEELYTKFKKIIDTAFATTTENGFEQHREGANEEGVTTKKVKRRKKGGGCDDITNSITVEKENKLRFQIRSEIAIEERTDGKHAFVTDMREFLHTHAWKMVFLPLKNQAKTRLLWRTGWVF